MRRTLNRVTVGAMVVLVAAALAGSALGAGGHGYGPRMGFQVFRAGPFGPGGPPGGPMFFGGPGGFGIRVGIGPFGPGGPGGGGVLTSDLAAGKTLAQEATAKNKKPDDLINAIVAAQKTNLDNQKAAGWITADQETAILNAYTNEVTDLVNNGPPVPPGAKAGGLLQTAATFLGMSVSDLQSALKSGKSLADVAKAQGKNVDDLVTALLAPMKTKLDQAVTDGKITSAQETAILNKLTTALTGLVNHTPSFPMGAMGMGMLGKFAAVTAFGKKH